MELVKYKAIDRDRHRLKKKMWERFCSKDYPKSLPTEKFLTIFFKEAKKHTTSMFVTTLLSTGSRQIFSKRG